MILVYKTGVQFTRMLTQAVCCITFMLWMCFLSSAPGKAETLIDALDVPVKISAQDVLAELEYLPEPQLSRAREDMGVLIQLINDLYRRKNLALRARSEGLADDSDIQRRITKATEQVLADSLIQRRREVLRAEAPDMKERAQEFYRANPDRYTIPDRVSVRHILLSAITPEGRAARRAEAEDLLTRLRSGEEFETLAREYSEDSGTAKDGGLLRPFKHGRMVKPFEEAAFGLEHPGDLSEIVETRYGLHILRLEDREPARQIPFEEVEEALNARLRREWVSEALSHWERELSGPESGTVNKAALDAFIAEVQSGGTDPEPTMPEPEGSAEGDTSNQ